MMFPIGSTQIIESQNEMRLHVEGDNKGESTDNRSFENLSHNRILEKGTSRFL